MKVSVIIPNYNHARYLKQRIDSILDQTFRDFEIFIIDDCSTDNSREIIDDYASRYPFISAFFNSSNSGSPFMQWDIGVKKAKGEFIWIAESDDFAEPLFLEKTLSIIGKNENLGMVYCDSNVYDDQNEKGYHVSDKKKFFNKNKWKHDYYLNGKKEICDNLYLACTINNVSSVLFRKSKYIEAGFADHNMKFCGDWYMYIKILLISDIAYISVPLNNFRLHLKSSFHSYFTSNIYLKEVLKVYSFVIKHVRLSPKKKILMGLYLSRVAFRRIINFF